jgi:hypothetical protein
MFRLAMRGVRVAMLVGMVVVLAHACATSRKRCSSAGLVSAGAGAAAR